jgi:prophage maintenance system killer protein
MSSAAKRTFRFLTVRQVALLRLSVLPDSPSQPPLLESALSSPINIRHYTKEQNVFLLAANLAEKLIKNHAFQDGNKRTAMVVADMFLKVNGYKLQDKPLAMDQVRTLKIPLFLS